VAEFLVLPFLFSAVPTKRKRGKSTWKPSVGPNINEITQYFVYVDGTYYVLNSILSSVDCCFKAIHSLNLEYSLESIPVWSFVQKGFYQINTAWDTEFVSVNSLFSDIGMYDTIVTP